MKDVSEGNAGIELPVVGEDEPKQVLEFRGDIGIGKSHLSGQQFLMEPVKDEITYSAISSELISMVDKAAVKTGLPSDYEIRRDAMQAAATYCNGGGWGDIRHVIAQAKEVEEYLRGKR